MCGFFLYVQLWVYFIIGDSFELLKFNGKWLFVFLISRKPFELWRLINPKALRNDSYIVPWGEIRLPLKPYMCRVFFFFLSFLPPCVSLLVFFFF